MDLSKRELATVLAALRNYQRDIEGVNGDIADIATDSGALQALNSAEIDALCENLNLATGELERADQDEIEAAREQYQTDEVKVDDGAMAARGDETVWVQAWVLLAPVEA